MPASARLVIVITGACGELGRACAEALSRRNASLILCDCDRSALEKMSAALGATAILCDLTTCSEIRSFAAKVSREVPKVNALINAAGGGYERTLSMHHVSRALMPALHSSSPNAWILNVPPSETDARSPIFPYASSREAFARLTAAIAQEAHAFNISVGIACPGSSRIEYAGDIAVRSSIGKVMAPRDPVAVASLAERVADLLVPPIEDVLCEAV